jgi:SAM-dependent methyltransferase
MICTNLLDDQHVEVYDSWFAQHSFVSQSEIEAVREMLPEGDKLLGLEVGLEKGRYWQALHVKEGLSKTMRTKAIEHGIETMDVVAEQLPYSDLKFDFVLMLFCVSYFKRLNIALREAYRVLKNDGALVIGFIDKESPIGRAYEAQKNESIFYKHANFYSVDTLVNELSDAGFRHFSFRQTLLGELENIQEFQPAKEGYGEGSFVVIKALKKFPAG